MRRRAAVLALILSACASLPKPAPRSEAGFLLRSLALEGIEHRYTVYVPWSYDPSRPAAAILFLHGAGERGEDGLLPTEVGLANAIRRHPERWPAIVVFPQAPRGRQWAGDAERIALAVLDEVRRSYRIDPERIYLTGLSMGGAGTWSLAAAAPRRFAAIVPICGWIVPMADRPEYHRDLRASGWDPAAPYTSAAERLRGLPVWIWHGSDDRAVPVDESRRMAAALRAAGAEVRYTELEGVGHNSWDAAYGSEELAEWLLRSRASAAAPPDPEP